MTELDLGADGDHFSAATGQCGTARLDDLESELAAEVERIRLGCDVASARATLLDPGTALIVQQARDQIDRTGKPIIPRPAGQRVCVTREPRIWPARPRPSPTLRWDRADSAERLGGRLAPRPPRRYRSCPTHELGAHQLGSEPMPRLTVDLSPQTHRALKEAAARQRRSIDAVVEERLERRSAPSVEEIVARAGESAGLSEEEAMDLAVREVRLHRQGR